MSSNGGAPYGSDEPTNTTHEGKKAAETKVVYTTDDTQNPRPAS
ncbi:hypothetical protein [Streptomyces sp. SA15]